MLEMKLLIAVALLVVAVTASPLMEKREQTQENSNLLPSEFEYAGPMTNRKVRQFGIGGFGGGRFGGLGGGVYDNTNFDAYSQGGGFGGLGGFGGYQNRGFDYSQQQGGYGIGGGLGGFGGYGGGW